MAAFDSLSPALVAGVVLIFFLGGLVKGTLGFGLPLVTMAVLPLFIPVDMALAINALVSAFTNISQFFGSRLVRPTLRRFWPVVVGVAAGVPVGAIFVTAIDAVALQLFLGVFLVLFSGVTAFTPRFTIPYPFERQAGLGVGFAAGVIGALTTTNGPLFVSYLLGLSLDRKLFVAALGLFFIVTGWMMTLSFAAVGILDLSRVLVTVPCLAASLLGMKAGDWLADRIPAEKFRLMTLGALAILGLNLVVQSAGAL